MRREFTAGRGILLAQRMLAYAQDELGMATLKLALRDKHELPHPGGEDPVVAHERLFRLFQHEVVPMSVDNTVKKQLAEQALTHCKGQLRYLKGLAAARARAKREGVGEGVSGAPQTPLESEAAEGGGVSSEDTGDPPPQGKAEGRDGGGRAEAGAGGSGEQALGAVEGVCPVCQEGFPLGLDVAVMPCGHAVCARCMVRLEERIPSSTANHLRRVKCPTCRLRVHVGDIALARGGTPSLEGREGGGAEGLMEGEAGVRVEGEFGTKVTAVVRRLKWILGQAPSARALVFSDWADVLELVAHACSANGVPALHVKGRHNMPRMLALFQVLHNCHTLGTRCYTTVTL